MSNYAIANVLTVDDRISREGIFCRIFPVRLDPFDGIFLWEQKSNNFLTKRLKIMKKMV